MPKILIADDSIAVRKVAERLLTEAGMGVTLAANGSEAMALLSKDRPDLIVSDVIMPDKSGYEVCSFIRAQANLADIPVLLISGIVNDEVSRQAESCKADGVLKKPFQGTSLKDRVLDLLTKRQAKPAPAPEPAPSQARTDRSVVEERPTASIVRSPEESERSATMHPAEPDAIRLTVNIPDATASSPASQAVAPNVSSETDERHAAAMAQREARIAELEEQLACEGRQSHEQIQQLQTALAEQRAQVEDWSSRMAALDLALAEERAQRGALAEQLADVSREAHRAGELEAALAEARRYTEDLSQQVAASAHQAGRILELEATLTAERDAAAQLVQQITALEHAESRARDLETQLAGEREEGEQLRNHNAELGNIAAQVPGLEGALQKERARIAELEAILSTERETAATLLTQVKQLEEVVQRAQELDTELAGERERSTQLMKRATEAEQQAEQSNRRFEDMARKLGEIAGLASQLGKGKR
ncbi:MAG: hypothetical protein OJF52_001912 [Nitrospira sp.]|jgi:CheY-like chemotaxis protein|nr:MAG: hypothetical protein OJF52_001912 [Nitrospira sp.]